MADFKTANALLTQNVRGVCERYLPRGQIKGTWWLVSTPWRVDKNPSLVVHLQTGKWKDLARPEERGDLIDLISRITGDSAADVVKEVCGE